MRARKLEMPKQEPLWKIFPHSPRCHAEKYPICLGKGKILKEGWATAKDKKVCHGCGGLGWVTVKGK